MHLPTPASRTTAGAWMLPLHGAGLNNPLLKVSGQRMAATAKRARSWRSQWLSCRQALWR